MRDQCKDLAFIPERIKELEMVESTLDKLVIKLPPKEMIEESERIIPGLASYPTPAYYYQKFLNGSSMTNEEFLYSRIARLHDWSVHVIYHPAVDCTDLAWGRVLRNPALFSGRIFLPHFPT